MTGKELLEKAGLNTIPALDGDRVIAFRGDAPLHVELGLTPIGPVISISKNPCALLNERDHTFQMMFDEDGELHNLVAGLLDSWTELPPNYMGPRINIRNN